MSKAKEPRPEPEQIQEAMRDETDRGCVLVGTSWIENRLRLLIKQTLQAVTNDMKNERENAVDSLLTNQFGLGTTRIRLLFCKSMMLIDDTTHDAIDNLTRLRNHFAHWAGPSTLE